MNWLSSLNPLAGVQQAASDFTDGVKDGAKQVVIVIVVALVAYALLRKGA